MEDSTLPSAGARLEKWGCCRCIPPLPPKKPTPLLHARALIFFYRKDHKKSLKKSDPTGVQTGVVTTCPVTTGPPLWGDQWLSTGRLQSTSDWCAVADRALAGPPLFEPPPPASFLLPPTSNFFCVWSTLPHCLHHMPTLPRLLLQTSNTHNF
jgi:hypothetical protein